MGDLLALGADALELAARGLRVVFGLLPASGVLRGTSRPLRLHLVVHALKVPVHLLKSCRLSTDKTKGPVGSTSHREARKPPCQSRAAMIESKIFTGRMAMQEVGGVV